MRIGRILILVAAVAVVSGAPALAFHDGGVADCAGCHTMHNSQNGTWMNYDSAGNLGGTGPTAVKGWNDLLLWELPTDVCLSCHEGTNNRYDVWAEDVLAPNVEYGGGDFVFLEEDNIYDGHSGTTLGHEAGHSIVSKLMNSPADPVLDMAPGGTYPADSLGCTSCHDPHGNASFRLLYQKDQEHTSTDGFTVAYAVTLEAEGIATRIPSCRPEPCTPDPPDGTNGPERNDHHNWYKDNYSEWCSSCHTTIHDGYSNDIHPSGFPIGSTIAGVYNKYTGSEDCAGVAAPCGTGTQAAAYLAEVPFEDDDATGRGINSTKGPDASSKVVCVSCHRAHASSAPDAGRWDFNLTGLAEDGASGSYAIPNPYNEYQRSLCNKCHAQDEYDELVDFS